MNCWSRYYRFFQQKLLSPLAFCRNDGSVSGCGCQNLSTLADIVRGLNAKGYSVFLTEICHYIELRLSKASISTYLLGFLNLKISKCGLSLQFLATYVSWRFGIMLFTRTYCRVACMKSLVALKLDGNILLDVPRKVGLPSLQTLQLQRVIFFDGETTFRRLLSICPVLEHPLVKFRGGVDDIMGMVTVIVPSLQSLSLQIPFDGLVDELVLDTPSLKYLKLEDYKEGDHSCLIENMPKLGEAFVDVNFPDIESLIGSITSVKRLTLSSEAVYSGGFVFNQLERLKLCVGTDYASNLLARLLESSPNLRVLDLFEVDHKFGEMICWNQPGTVPKCITSSLQTFIWSGYLGRPQDRDLTVYILKNACCLKTATFSTDESYTPKFEMMKELSRSSRASTTCQLLFD